MTVTGGLSTSAFARTNRSALSQSADEPRAMRANDESDNTSEGTYFVEQWINGQVKMEGGTEYENIPLKYNSDRNALVTINGGGNERIIEAVRSFAL